MDYDWPIRQYRTTFRRYMTHSNACDYSPGIFEILQLKSDQASRSAGARHSWLIGLSLLELSILLGDDTITVLCNGNGIRIGFIRTNSAVDSLVPLLVCAFEVSMDQVVIQPAVHLHRSPGIPYSNNFAM